MGYQVKMDAVYIGSGKAFWRYKKRYTKHKWFDEVRPCSKKFLRVASQVRFIAYHDTGLKRVVNKRLVRKLQFVAMLNKIHNDWRKKTLENDLDIEIIEDIVYEK